MQFFTTLLPLGIFFQPNIHTLNETLFKSFCFTFAVLEDKH